MSSVITNNPVGVTLNFKPRKLKYNPKHLFLAAILQLDPKTKWTQRRGKEPESSDKTIYNQSDIIKSSISPDILLQRLKDAGIEGAYFTQPPVEETGAYIGVFTLELEMIFKALPEHIKQNYLQKYDNELTTRRLKEEREGRQRKAGGRDSSCQ